MIISGKQKPLPVHYDEVLNTWIVEVKDPLPDSAMNSLREYVYKINKDRWLSAHGDQKDHIGKALKALVEGKLQQRLSGQGDQNLFKSTEGSGKIFSFGGK